MIEALGVSGEGGLYEELMVEPHLVLRAGVYEQHDLLGTDLVSFHVGIAAGEQEVRHSPELLVALLVHFLC